MICRYARRPPKDKFIAVLSEGEFILKLVRRWPQYLEIGQLLSRKYVVLVAVHTASWHMREPQMTLYGVQSRILIVILCVSTKYFRE
jgi:hypothetical protein